MFDRMSYFISPMPGSVNYHLVRQVESITRDTAKIPLRIILDLGVGAGTWDGIGGHNIAHSKKSLQI